MGIINLKAWEIKEKIHTKEVSAREITQLYLNNINKNINAFITIDADGALATSDKVDIKIQNGEEIGILAGIPIGIKDNIVTKEIRTTCGSKMLENFISPYDATVIEKIKAQDGIIIGKTNMDEFAMGSTTETSYFGSAKNPLDMNLVPGGSSGGSAAAVAASEVALALGSDTGGSVRQPASFCGIVGIKPSFGVVSRYGLISMANTLDQIGVLGRDVRDAVLLLNAIDGYDIKDPTSVNERFGNMIFGRNNNGVEETKLIKGMKIGVPKELFDIEMDSKVKDAFLKTVELYRENGAEIQEISLPHLKYAIETYEIISNAEISSNLARFDGLRYGFRAKDYETLDELYINSRTEAFGDEVKRRIITGTYLLSSYNDIYLKALRVRTLIKDDFELAFKKYDIILTPTSPILPYELNEDKKMKSNQFTLPVNLAGNCALTVPYYINGNLPVGIQIIGDKFKELNIIKAGLAFEGMVK